MLKEVERGIRLCRGSQEPFSWVVGVSGGADSMAMLSLLHALSRRFDLELTVGHFDHRLRETSSVDKRRVEVMASGLGVPFYSGEADVRSRAHARGETIEEAARKLRYRFLFRLARQIGADSIATGHTSDDQIETVIMRFLRGTGIRGLAGIPAKRGKLIRPILGMTHEQALDYCRDHHIAYVEDPTNQDKRFTRNWIRHELLPVIRAIFPNVGENILRLSRNSADALRRIRRVTNPLLERHLRREESGEWALDLTKIRRLDGESKYVLFGDLLIEHLGSDPDFSRLHFEKLARLSADPGASGRKLSLPGVTVRREYDVLVFKPAPDHPIPVPLPGEPVALDVPGRCRYGDMSIRAAVISAKKYRTGMYRSTEPVLFESNSHRARGVAYFALEAIAPPLTVRAPEPGDRMRPFGLDGHKKLSDIFGDKKIPVRRRDKIVVVSDQKEILWLVGVATSESTRISAASKNILKITVIPE